MKSNVKKPNYNFDDYEPKKPLDDEGKQPLKEPTNQLMAELKQQRKQRPVKTMVPRVEKQKQPMKVCKAPITPKHAKEQKPPGDGNTLDFPIEIMTGLAGDFARIYGNHLEPPDHFFFMSYLTIFGLYVSDKLWLKSQRKPAPRFYTILLGESADTRKSTAIEETERHFSEFIKLSGDNNSFAVCRGAASGEGLGRLLKQYIKVLLYYDELKGFVSKAGIKNSTLLTATNTFFEDTKYENLTSRDPLVIDYGLVAMLAASTTDTYANIFNSKFLDIGFNNRLFIVPGDSTKCFPVPKSIPPEQVHELHNKLSNRIQLLDDLRDGMPIEPDALEKWSEFYQQIQGSSPHTKRLDVYGLRFMPIISLNDMKTSIDLETVEKTIQLLKWQHYVRQVHDPIDASGLIARMEESIRRAFIIESKWTRRDLQRKVSYTRDGLWVWKSAIKNLIENDEMWFDAKKKTYDCNMSEKPQRSIDDRFAFPKGLSNADIKKLNE